MQLVAELAVGGSGWPHSDGGHAASGSGGVGIVTRRQVSGGPQGSSGIWGSSGIRGSSSAPRKGSRPAPADKRKARPLRGARPLASARARVLPPVGARHHGIVGVLLSLWQHRWRSAVVNPGTVGGCDRILSGRRRKAGRRLRLRSRLVPESPRPLPLPRPPHSRTPALPHCRLARATSMAFCCCCSSSKVPTMLSVLASASRGVGTPLASARRLPSAWSTGSGPSIGFLGRESFE